MVAIQSYHGIIEILMHVLNHVDNPQNRIKSVKNLEATQIGWKYRLDGIRICLTYLKN